MYDVTSNFASATTLQFGLANNDSTPDASILTGNRPLNKYGTGTLTITGNASFTGLSTVLAGTMAVDGSIPGDVTVDLGATLKGTGSIGGTATILDGATLAPGNPTGALTVNILDLQPSATTSFELTPSVANSSELIVTGLATLDGNLTLVQNTGFYLGPLTYTLVEAGSMSGEFHPPTIVSPYSGFNFSVKYLTNALELLMQAQLPTSGLSGNDLIFANYLNTAGASSLALHLLAHVPAGQMQQAINAASPTRNAIPTFVAGKALFSVESMIGSHLDARLFEVFADTSLAMNDLPRDILKTELDDLSLIAASQDRVPAGRLEEGVRSCENNGLWAQGFADYAWQDEQAEVPEFHFTVYGFLLGYDRYMQNGWTGVTAGYAHTSISEDHNLGRSDINAVILAPYGTAIFSDAYFEGSLVAAYNRVRQKRHISFPGFTCKAESSYNIWQLMPHIGFGYDFTWDSFILEPFASFDFLTMWQESYHEKDCPAFDMKIKSRTSFFLQSELGLRFYQRWARCWGVALLQETIAYVNQAPFSVGTVNAALVGNEAFFTVKSFKHDQNLFGFGLSGIVKGNSGFYGILTVNGEVGSGYFACEPQVRIGRLF